MSSFLLLKKYLNATYKDGGRGEIIDGVQYFDCWGIARAARVELYGRDLLGSHAGEFRFDPEGFTAGYQKQIAEMVEISKPVPGSIVAVLRRRSGICHHVGLIMHDINRTGLGLHVLEINPDQNARVIPVYRFFEGLPLREFKFYDDTSISK